MNLRRLHLNYGLDVRRGLSGAALYVKIFQLISILPLPYIFIATVYMGITGSTNVFSVLFDIGMAASPRAEVMLLSYIYRITGSECLVYFALPVIALILGLIADRVLTGDVRRSLAVHKIAAVLIAADLILRLIPIHANIAFGLPAAISGFLIRAACLFLVIRDIRTA